MGEALIRLAPDRGERLESASRLNLHVGGAESNVAVALARLGCEVTWLSALPATPLGRLVEREIRGAGVDTAHVRWVPKGRVGLYFVEFGGPPRPTAVWYDRADSAFAAAQELELVALEGAAYASISGVTPAVSRSARTLTERFVERARVAGAAVCVDVNYRSRLWPPGEARQVLGRLLGMADIVVCSRSDARVVFGLTGESEAVLDSFRAKFAPEASVVVLTEGAGGCLASVGDGAPVRQPAFPATIVDRFGMGDAFVGGLLWRLLRQPGDVGGALAAASATASLKATMQGDHALVTVAEVESLMRSPPEPLLR